MRTIALYATLSACLLAVLIFFGTQAFPHLTDEALKIITHPSAPPPVLLPPPRVHERPPEDHHGQKHMPEHEWVFDHRRDSRNYGLSDEQCLAAFPLLYHDIDRAVAHRKSIGNITRDEVDVGWRGDGITRALVRDNQLYVIDAHGVWDHNHRPRSFATLHSLHRAVSSYPGVLPNVEFTLTDHDSALINRDGNHTTWAYSRLAHQESLWLMPDFGFWGWPDVNLRSFAEFRAILDDSEDDFADKIPKVVWRGTLKVAGSGMRTALLSQSEGHPWSDVRLIDWSNATDIHAHLLSMEDHCAYMFVVQTEGNTYSGRLKYLLNCRSIVLSHELRWIEHYHHLLHASGPEQNYVQLKRDFSDLPQTMTRLLRPATLDGESRAIVDNARRVFRERYLTPAAEACYWRALIRGWASVQGFEPQLWVDSEAPDWHVGSGGKKVKRRPRGAPFESYAIMEQVEWEVPSKARHLCIDE